MLLDSSFPILTAFLDLGLNFDNRYAWVTKWNTQGLIVEARAYLDSHLVSEALQQNELGTHFTYNDRKDEIVPFISLPKVIVEGETGLSQG